MLIISGCTGIGKTEVANKLSKSYPLHLISCDSIQIYKDMNIGSNKGNSSTNHSLIDISCWRERFNLYKFEQKLLEILNENKDNKIPCIVGGTGLYLINIISKYDIESKDINNGTSIVSIKTMNNTSTMDTNITSRPHSIDINNNTKSINTIDTCSRLINISDIDYISNELNYLRNKKIKCNFKFFLTSKREILYRKVDKRCEDMILSGFLEEVIALYFDGLTDNYISGRSIGYRDGLNFINKSYQRIKKYNYNRNEIFNDLEYFIGSFKDFLEIFKRKTRNYIARQECWYKNRGFIWIDCSRYNAYDIISRCLKYLTERNFNFNEIDSFLKEVHRNSMGVNKECFKSLKRYKSNNQIFNNSFNFDKFLEDLIDKIINFKK